MGQRFPLFLSSLCPGTSIGTAVKYREAGMRHRDIYESGIGKKHASDCVFNRIYGIA